MDKNTKSIVFFDGSLQAGGAERVISILVNRLADEGKNICLLLYKDEDVFYQLNSRVKIVSVRKETGSKNIIKNIIWIHRFIKNAKMVISFLAPFNMVMLLAHIGVSCPIIVADRNDPRFIPNNSLARRCRDALYQLANKIVLQTQRNKAYFSNKLQSKSIVIPNPVDLGDKQGLGLRVQKRKEIVSVGRLMPVKNQMLLLDAFAMIAGNFPDYCLTIYGEGPERLSLESRIKELGIESRVNLPGKTQKVWDEMAHAEIFVLSSNYEGMPNALMEAMGLGLPCIATDVSGVRDLIKDGENGLVVDVDNKVDLANKITFLLDDLKVRNDIGKHALSINKSHSLDKIMFEWEKAIESIIR